MPMLEVRLNLGHIPG